MNNLQYIKKEFLKEMYKRIKELEKFSYSIEKIANLFEYPSKIEEYSKMLNEVDLDEKTRLSLKNYFEKILKHFQSKQIFEKIIIESKLNENNSKTLNDLEKTLDKYMTLLFQEHCGLGKIIQNYGDKKIIEYFELLPKSADETLIPIQYRKIIIILEGNKFCIFATKKHLSENYQKVDNIVKFTQDIKNSIKEIDKKRKKLSKFGILSSFTTFLFKSMYYLARDLAISDKKHIAILKNLK